MMTKNTPDEILWRDWAESRSETAFAEIVRRYVGLVYHTCWRELQDRSLAEDAAQAVFIVLAQKGKVMTSCAHLVGWLFRTSRLVCKDVAKAERRRRHKEFLAGAARIEPSEDPGESLANSAVVNDALSALHQTEREAVLLRFYDQRSFQEVGETLDMSDDTAQKCVSRALEKMRGHLLKAGITATALAITAFLSSESARSAPPETLAKALLAVSALPGGQIAGALVGTKAYQISQGVLHTMRLKMIAVSSAAAIFIACGILLASQIHEGPELLMVQSRAVYAGAKSFSMVIDNHKSSGLYGGDYTQQLIWHSGNKFTLKVITPGNKTVPDYIGDGTHVTTILPDGKKRVDPWPDSNESPGWEVTGGFILSWLENTPDSNIIFSPPQGFAVTWSYGPRTTWRGHAVKELVATAFNRPQVGERSGTESFFIDTRNHEYVGFEWANNGKPGYALYKDQKLTR